MSLSANTRKSPTGTSHGNGERGLMHVLASCTKAGTERHRRRQCPQSSSKGSYTAERASRAFELVAEKGE